MGCSSSTVLSVRNEGLCMILILFAVLWNSRPRLVGRQPSAGNCLIYQSGRVNETILGVVNENSVTYP